MQISHVKSNESSLHQTLKLLYQTDENIQKEVSLSVNGQKFRLDLLDEKNNIIYEVQRTSFGGRF